MNFHRGQLIVILHHLFLILGIAYYGFNITYAIAIFFLSMFWTYLVAHHIIHIGYAHRTYRDTLLDKLKTIPVLISGLGSPLSFSASHRRHHKYPDTEKDPHSPKHIGFFRVYCLAWEQQSIAPRSIIDFARSSYQQHIHKYWFYYHVLISVVAFIINPVLLCFIVSPFVMYTFHAGSIQNTIGHIEGKPTNYWLVAPFLPWSWKHRDHHFH